MSGRLVEEEHRRVDEQRPRDDEPLPLSAREPTTLLPDERVQPVGKRARPSRRAARVAERLDELVVGRVRAARA